MRAFTFGLPIKCNQTKAWRAGTSPALPCKLSRTLQRSSGCPILRLAVILAALVLSIPAQAARCGGDFNTFVAAMSQEAAAAGISQGVISQAFAGVTQDPAVLSFDRRQRGTFNKTLEEQYVSNHVGPGRIKTGKAMLQRHASLLARIQQRFGVPPEIVVAIWGLESDFGKGDIGKMPVIRTLTTMAHDCRRTELFARANCSRR